MISMNPVQYIQQVRAEVAKVVWPTRKEVLLTTVMVFVMSAVTAVFFRSCGHFNSRRLANGVGSLRMTGPKLDRLTIMGLII